MPPTPSSASRRHAFTLIELLVVISIVAILVSLLVAGMKTSIDKANEAKSIGNLRAIGQGLTAYLTENNNQYPYNAKALAAGDYWPDVIGAYLPAAEMKLEKANGETFTTKSVLVCPLLKMKQHHAISDYGVNNAVIIRETTGNSQLAAATIPKPSQTVMAMAAQQTGSGVTSGTWYVDASKYINGTANSFIPSDRDIGRILTVFVDGHTEAIAKATFEENKRTYLLPNP